MTFFNILERIGYKLIRLKFVGFSISPYLWIGIVNRVLPRFRNFIAIDVLIISIVIVTIILSLICWRLIWSCPVDLAFLSFDIANITYAACTGWGLHNEDFLVIRGWVFSCMYRMQFIHWSDANNSHLHTFFPCCCRMLLNVLVLDGGVVKIAFVLLRFSRSYCFSRFQVSVGFALAFLSVSW